MSLTVRPFCGVRFDEKRFSLGRVLCPPYDVFTPKLTRRLRRVRENAVHLELPAGASSVRYSASRRRWESWLRAGVLRQDRTPAYYVVEQRFRFRGRGRVRTGILCALGLDAGTARRVLRHERTMAKPKVDRTRLLKTLKANTSPIFGICTDPGGRLRRELAAARRRRPLAAGRDVQGVSYRLWRLDDPRKTGRIERIFRTRSVLIADGHHRYEVARDYWRASRADGADGVLAYLVAETDPGLLVSPTQRVARPTAAVRRALERRCAGRSSAGLAALMRGLARARSPYAFGLYDGAYRLMEPAAGDRGVRSRFGLDWLARRILAAVDPQEIAYFHAAGDAVREAKRRHGLAFMGRPFSVADIRRAVRRAGLLPQKSTYFFPKIASGLAFRSF
ncbi:MAG: DUF1015 domain-containing protein [Elusimicrobiota bacterium]